MYSSAMSSELAETSGTQVDTPTVQKSLARSGHHGRLAAKQPYLQHGNKAERLNHAQKHGKWGEGKWQQVLWTACQNLKYLAVAEGSFFSLEAGTIMSIGEVSRKFGAAFLQMEIFSGLMVA